MFNNPETLEKLSMIVTSSYFYIILIMLFAFCNVNQYSRISYSKSIVVLLAMSGLPPFPTFFTKLWMIYSISATTMGFVFLTTILLNSALLYAYLNFILKGKKNYYIKSSKKPTMSTDYITPIIFLTTIFFFIPELFRIL